MSKISFFRRAMPVIPDHRPMYKICLVLLILHECSSGGKSSLIRLHLFNWAFKKEERLRVLIESAKQKTLLCNVWGIDPTLNVALNHAVANGLILKIGQGYQITPDGKKFILNNEIKNQFEDESKVFDKIKKNITKKMIDDVIKRWKNEI